MKKLIIIITISLLSIKNSIANEYENKDCRRIKSGRDGVAYYCYIDDHTCVTTGGPAGGVFCFKTADQYK